MNRLAVLALAILTTSPTLASTSLLPRLAEVDAAAANDTPRFECSEPGNKDTCQQARAVIINGEGFSTFDFANGVQTRCFFPKQEGPAYYSLCETRDTHGIDHFSPNITINETVTTMPKNDPRCTQWGSADTIECLTCESQQPQKLNP